MATEKKKKARGKIDATGRWVIFATVSASSMAFIMQSALGPAQPAFQINLGASGADLLWIFNAYNLLVSAFLLLGGSLGDRYGRKRIYAIGIVIFALACAACGFAPNVELLIAFRAVQGLGGALMIPGSLALISAYFDDNTRGVAIGTWSSFTTGASLLAPALGGVLVDLGYWRLIFFLCLPLAAAALFALYRFVPESMDDDAPRGLDISGTILIALSLAGMVYGATEIGRTQAYASPLYLGALIGGIVGLGLFFWVEMRSKHPLVPPKLFKSRTFTGVNILTLLLYGALAGALQFFPLNLIQIQGYSATIAGVAVIPMTILLMVMSPWAGRLVDNYGPRIPLIVGPFITGTGFAVLAIPGVTSGVTAYFWTFLPGLALMGLGMGLTVAPLTTAALGSVPQHNSGVASGVNNLMSRASGVLAIAILGGVMLVSFTNALTIRVNDLPIADESQAVMIDDAGNLAETTIPDTLGEDDTEATEMAVRQAFVVSFRIVMLIGAVMAWLSAAIAWYFVEEELAPPPELMKKAQIDAS